MLPERLIVSRVVLPVGRHVREQVRLSVALEDRRDVGELLGDVAVLNREEEKETANNSAQKQRAF